MKILDAEQTRAWDAFTIEHENLKSGDLMNRAAQAFVRWFTDQYRDSNRPVWIICGTGNNGGDGLAIARYLNLKFYSVRLFIGNFSKKYSPDFEIQLKNLPVRGAVPVVWMEGGSALPKIPADVVVIDALFGSGLTRALEGNWQILGHHLNQLSNEIVAVDVPSGLFIDRHTSGVVVRATHTFSFETPKMAFFFAENAEKVGNWHFSSIGLNPAFLKTASGNHFFITRELVKNFLKKRKPFDHKGTFGHAFLVAGSLGKAGAAILAARAAMRSGAGLLTVLAAKSVLFPLQIGVPEAICAPDVHENWPSQLPQNIEKFNAVGIGPGIGTEVETLHLLEILLKKVKNPLVLDADALNLLAAMPRLLKNLPINSIITPHPKEFERLFGKTENDFVRHDLAVQKAKELQIFIVLKGGRTLVATPDGQSFFNSTGNPGMATAGSGDVLTGLLTGLLAQGYSPLETCLLGVFLHGLAGDLAAVQRSKEALLAGDLVDFLGNAFCSLGFDS
jgi:ADP-dependent NAD(P)H-hydrate dehydratase / NAD(P)H-hydrate epimerase